jgi:hypothetical protein
MYVKLTNGQPEIYTIGQLRRDNPNTSFPKNIPDERLAEYDVYPVTALDRPTTEIWQRATRNDLPTLVDGVWTLDWTVTDIPATIEMVKAEAGRRIIAICPEWKQRNLTAQAAQLAKKGEANWTPEEQEAWDAGEALWNQIAAIRAASDVIEAMDPIPANFYDLPDWP